MPNTSHSEIAKYWSSPQGRARWPGNRAVGDSAEPARFACGYFAKAWDTSGPGILAWNDARGGLERAHLIADSQGGEDSPANLILLCPDCHRDAPMTNNEHDMFTWCERREYFMARRARRLAEELQALGVDPADPKVAGLSPESLHRAAVEIDAGVHLTRMSEATMALAIRHALRSVS